MILRFHIDPETQQPHVYNHGITEEEVRQVMALPGLDQQGSRQTRMKLGQTAAGRYLQVIYSPDEVGDSVFVIAAHRLVGKALKAYRRQLRTRGR